MRVLLTVALSLIAIISGLIFAASTICAFAAPEYGFLIYAVIALAAVIGSVRVIRKINNTE